MEAKKVGKIPANAGITVDYTKEKPKISFSYPNKKVHQGIISIVIFLTLIVISLLAIQYFITGSDEFYDYPKSCDYIPNIENGLLESFDLICDNGLNFKSKYFPIYYNKKLSHVYGLGYIYEKIAGEPFYLSYEDLYERSIEEMFIGLFLFMVVVGGILLLIGCFSSFIEKQLLKINYFKEKFPKWNAKISGKKYHIAFDKVPDSLYLEIPLFSNVVLNYNAEGEFSKYLTKFEIKEHPFNKVMFKKGKIKKKEKQDMLWYVRWYFSEKPKTGKLEVIFR